MGQDNKKAAPGANRAASDTALDNLDRTPPTVTGQCAAVLNLIREQQPVLSFTMTADHAILEAAARIHDLRAMGFNILTTIHPAIEFRGQIRRNVASYSLGTPGWPQPGYPLRQSDAGTVKPTPLSEPPEFFEAGAKCVKKSADQIAASIPALPEEEKPTARRAILRSLRNWLDMARWHQLLGSSAVGGRAGV